MRDAAAPAGAAGHGRTRRAAIVTVALLMAAAAPPASFRPGLWLLSSAPGTATLDGRPLRDLPYTPPSAPDRVCLSAADATDVTAWLARGVAAQCRFTRRTVAGGRVDLRGTCAPQAPGLDSGTVRITGRWSPDRYALRFATINPGENGRMGFSGTLTGRRVGSCP